MSIRSRIEQKRFQDPADEAVVGLFVVAGVLDDLCEAACAEHGITAVQYNVLRILRGVHPEGHPRGEIARRLITRAPDVTRLLDRLVRSGLVERHWDAANRRLSIARITQKGLKLLTELDPKIRRLQEHATRKLSKADLKALVRILDLMVDD
jgi:DNA-binding MarR family transcriptional regulator